MPRNRHSSYSALRPNAPKTNKKKRTRMTGFEPETTNMREYINNFPRRKSFSAAPLSRVLPEKEPRSLPARAAQRAAE